MKLKDIKICVDFDGTIVDNFDKPNRIIMSNAFEVLKKLKDAGAYLVFWSLREGVRLQEALDFCTSNGVVFDSINEIPIALDYRRFDKTVRRKPDAHHFIDDRNVGGFIGWDRVEEFLLTNSK